ACQGPPRPTQRSATSANGVTKSVPAKPSNRRSCTPALIAPALRVHAAIAIAAKYATPMGLIDSWDAKGAHADDNEAKKRDDAEKDVAHTADGIHRDLLIS